MWHATDGLLAVSQFIPGAHVSTDDAACVRFLVGRLTYRARTAKISPVCTRPALLGWQPYGKLHGVLHGHASAALNQPLAHCTQFSFCRVAGCVTCHGLVSRSWTAPMLLSARTALAAVHALRPPLQMRCHVAPSTLTSRADTGAGLCRARSPGNGNQ